MPYISQLTGFEPVRAEPNRFLVYRLNRSATTASVYNDAIPLSDFFNCPLTSAACLVLMVFIV